MRRSWFSLLAVVGLAAAPSAPAPKAPSSDSALRIDINIPAFRLDAYVGDSLVRRIPIAVGMPSFKSPRGEFAVESIEWNP
jgi:hypothetical protein